MGYPDEKIAFDFSKFSNKDLDEIIALCKEEKTKRAFREYSEKVSEFIKLLKSLSDKYPYEIAYSDGNTDWTWFNLFGMVCVSHEEIATKI